MSIANGMTNTLRGSFQGSSPSAELYKPNGESQLPPKGESQRPQKEESQRPPKGGEPSEPAYLRRIRDLALPGLPPRTCLPSPPRTCPPKARTWRSPECRQWRSIFCSEYIKLHLPSRLSAAGDGLLQLGLAQPTSIMPLVEVGDPTKMHQQRRMKDLSPG